MGAISMPTSRTGSEEPELRRGLGWLRAWTGSRFAAVRAWTGSGPGPGKVCVTVATNNNKYKQMRREAKSYRGHSACTVQAVGSGLEYAGAAKRLLDGL